jgi:histone H3/H4
MEVKNEDTDLQEKPINDSDITKPSIVRLARTAGVKSISDECFVFIRKVIDKKLEELLSTALIVNSQHQTKTLMSDDIYEALYLLGVNVTQSDDIGYCTFTK